MRRAGNWKEKICGKLWVDDPVSTSKKEPGP
jgi:hypothetical protein